MFNLIQFIVGIIVLYVLVEHFDLFFSVVSGLMITLLLLIQKLSNQIK